MNFSVALALILSASVAVAGEAPEAIPLWPNGAPGAKGEEQADIPTIRHYAAKQSDGPTAAVVVCPGGGYGVLAYDHEGHQVGRFFARHGVTAFVLRYRHSPYRHPIPLNDAQRAIRYVRHHAKKFGVDPQRVGVMGFSAGGHLASTVSTHFDAGQADAKDAVDRQSSRPDFAVLCYPVVNMIEPWGHGGSRRNLLGEKAGDDDLARSLSNDLQVTKDTPRTFLFHTAEDKGVPVENSLSYFRALRKHNVPAELHVYQNGPHGVGLGHGDPVLSTWPTRLIDWMRNSNLLAAAKRVPVSGKVTLDGKPIDWGTVAFEAAGDDGKWRPWGWAMIRRGNYSIAKESGPVVGKNRVKVVDWGGVKPFPTVDDAETVGSALTVDLQDGKNVIDLSLTSN